MFIGATLVRRSMPVSRNPKEKCEEMCSTGTREYETLKAKGGLPAEGFRTFVEAFIWCQKERVGCLLRKTRNNRLTFVFFFF